jgi:hypothetical protein
MLEIEYEAGQVDPVIVVFGVHCSAPSLHRQTRAVARDVSNARES